MRDDILPRFEKRSAWRLQVREFIYLLIINNGMFEPQKKSEDPSTMILILRSNLSVTELRSVVRGNG